MEIEIVRKLSGWEKERYLALLQQAGLALDADAERKVLIWENEHLIATGARQENLLKYIAVDAAHQGEGLTATVLTQLRQDAFSAGYRHLFLYTKPKNKQQFSSLFFYPIAQTQDVLLMENRKNGIQDFLQALPAPKTEGVIGSAVMNCNPFTLGHRYLIESAAKECDHLYVFILSEDKSHFSAKDRLEMAKLGIADLPNVTVLPTGPYLISSATFPTYFLKDRDQAEQIHCLLDIAIFTRYYLPKFGITRRYVGTEPLSPLTNLYNEALRRYLPIELRELPRLEKNGAPISASTVRASLPHIQGLVPETTYTYLQAHGLL